MNESRKTKDAQQQRRRCVPVWEWRELARRLDDLLGLDIYGQETDELWHDKLRGLREALLWVVGDPNTVHGWLRERGERMLRDIVAAGPPLSHETFQPYMADPFVRRLCKVLIKREVLPPFIREVQS